jgi:fatty-acyl-CoA synthase
MVELTVARALRLAATRTPENLALACGDRRLTFGELDELGNRIANALLAAGLKQGDRVGIMLPNSIEYVAIALAAAQAGFVMIPLNYRFTGPEIAYPLGDSNELAPVSWTPLMCRRMGPWDDERGGSSPRSTRLG